jgi:NarL family two-component system response regulator LiaR
MVARKSGVDNMTDSIRVVIVDDHDMLRKGIATMLYATDDLTLVGEASSGSEAIEMCAKLKPDVVLIDLMMPEMDGVTAIQNIHVNQPQIRIVVLSSFAEPDLIKSALKAGASGYVLKNISAEKLANAVRMAKQDIAPLSPEVMNQMFHPKDSSTQFNLTTREQEILSLLTDGFSNSEIAYRLSISQFTVKNHVSTIYTKLGVGNRTEAVRIAVQNNLV